MYDFSKGLVHNFMIYFDNAATGGRKPDCVISAVTSAMKVCANPGRGGHKLALACASVVQDCRNVLSDYFGGFGFDRVVFTKNCTEALNIALLGVLKAGDHVITTPMEHNSVLRPLEFLQQAGVITYDVCELNADGNVGIEALLKCLQPNTKMVALTTASNVTGALPPVQEIRKRLPKDVLLLCDGAQGGGHIPIHMKKMGIDLLAIAGHKGLNALQGCGALLFSERVNPAPLTFGGTGSMSISLNMPDFYPDALEAGTLSFPAIVSCLEGVRYLRAHEQEIYEKVFSLTKYCIDGIRALNEYVVYSQPNPCGIVAFAHSRLPSEQVAAILSSKYSIAVRGGLHCAPLMHEQLGTLDNGLVRVSFSHLNCEREIDELLRALTALKTR